APGVAGEMAFTPLGGADAPGNGQQADDDRREPGADLGVDPEETLRRGTLETAAAADGIVRAARRAGMHGQVSARSVFEAAAGGDPRAVEGGAAGARLGARALCCVINGGHPPLLRLCGALGPAPPLAPAVASG